MFWSEFQSENRIFANRKVDNFNSVKKTSSEFFKKSQIQMTILQEFWSEFRLEMQQLLSTEFLWNFSRILTKIPVGKFSDKHLRWFWNSLSNLIWILFGNEAAYFKNFDQYSSWTWRCSWPRNSRGFLWNFD